MPSPEIVHALAQGWHPPDRRSIVERVADLVNLPSGAVYDPPGPFHVEHSPYLLEPLLACDNDLVRFITIQAGVQTGKSLIGDVVAYDLVINRPQSVFINGPTDEWAHNWAKRRLMKLFEAPGPVAERIKSVREVNRHNAVTTQIIFANMWIAIQGANETNLQSFPVPFIINEELWEWAPSMYQHAIARTDHFEWRSKIINISQAGEVNSDQDQAYKAGTQEIWEVPCLHCDRYHDLPWNVRLGSADKPVWAGVTWDSNEVTRPKGVWDWQKLVPTCRIVCPHCLGSTPDDPTLRRKMNALGRTRVSNPNAPRNNRSFHWPSWANPGVSLGSVVEQYLRAKDQERIGNRVPIKEWWQKRAGISYDPMAHRTFEVAPAVDVVTEGTKHWDRQDFIGGFFDVQADHFWGLIVAWSKTGEDMNLWFGGGPEPEKSKTEPLWSFADIAEIQKRYSIPHQCMFLDFRHRTGEVYKECALHFDKTNRLTRCWNAIGGDARRDFLYTRTDSKGNAHRSRLPYSWPPEKVNPCTRLKPDDHSLAELRGRFVNRFLFAKGWIDPVAFERREMLMRGEMSYLTKGPWNEEFTKQLFGEEPEIVQPKFGAAKTKSKFIGRNHGLDCYRMSIMFGFLAEVIGDKRG